MLYNFGYNWLLLDIIFGICWSSHPNSAPSPSGSSCSVSQTLALLTTAWTIRGWRGTTPHIFPSITQAWPENPVSMGILHDFTVKNMEQVIDKWSIFQHAMFDYWVFWMRNDPTVWPMKSAILSWLYANFTMECGVDMIIFLLIQISTLDSYIPKDITILSFLWVSSLKNHV